MSTFRATITPHAFVVLDGEGAVPLTGPSASFARQALLPGTSVAEIEVSGSFAAGTGLPVTEAKISFLGGDNASVRRQILQWAGHVGFDWVWFDDEFCPPIAPELGTDAYETNCLVCGQHYFEHGLEFRRRVRMCGSFPFKCSVCRGPLPQWKEAQPYAKLDGPPATDLDNAYPSSAYGDLGDSPPAVIAEPASNAKGDTND